MIKFPQDPIQPLVNHVHTSCISIKNVHDTKRHTFLLRTHSNQHVCHDIIIRLQKFNKRFIQLDADSYFVPVNSVFPVYRLHRVSTKLESFSRTGIQKFSSNILQCICSVSLTSPIAFPQHVWPARPSFSSSFLSLPHRPHVPRLQLPLVELVLLV